MTAASCTRRCVMPLPRATTEMNADRNGKTISAMIQTALTHPDIARSRNRSPRMENNTIRYDTNANEMMMNQTTSQNDIAVSLLEQGSFCYQSSHRRSPRLISHG